MSERKADRRTLAKRAAQVNSSPFGTDVDPGPVGRPVGHPPWAARRGAV